MQSALSQLFPRTLLPEALGSVKSCRHVGAKAKQRAVAADFKLQTVVRDPAEGAMRKEGTKN